MLDTTFSATAYTFLTGRPDNFNATHHISFWGGALMLHFIFGKWLCREWTLELKRGKFFSFFQLDIFCSFFYFFTKFNWKIWQRITRVDFNLSKQKWNLFAVSCGSIQAGVSWFPFVKKMATWWLKRFHPSPSVPMDITSRLRFLMHYRGTLSTFWYNFPDEGKKNKQKRIVTFRLSKKY